MFLFGKGSLQPGPVVNKCVGKIWNVKKTMVLLASVVGSLLLVAPSAFLLGFTVLGKIYSVSGHRIL